MTPAPPETGPAPRPEEARRSRPASALTVLLALAGAAAVVTGVAHWGHLRCGSGVGEPACVTPPEQLTATTRLAATADGSSTGGRFRLALDEGVELDTAQPSAVRGPDGNLDDGDLFFDDRAAGGGRFYTADHPVAVWSGAAAAGSDGCQDAIATAGMWSVDAVAGQTLCVQTTGGRYAALTITQVAPGGVWFDATVWD
jgi:hypothetical protein